MGMIGERPFSHTDLIVSTCELILSRARAPLANLEGLAIESCRHCRRFGLRFLLWLRLLWHKHLLRQLRYYADVLGRP